MNVAYPEHVVLRKKKRSVNCKIKSTCIHINNLMCDEIFGLELKIGMKMMHAVIHRTDLT